MPIAQLSQQIEGKRKEAVLVEKDSNGVGQLVCQQLLSITRLHDLQSQSARLEGELGGPISSVAEAKGKITGPNFSVLRSMTTSKANRPPISVRSGVRSPYMRNGRSLPEMISPISRYALPRMGLCKISQCTHPVPSSRLAIRS